jgi:hypothetical protein
MERLSLWVGAAGHESGSPRAVGVGEGDLGPVPANFTCVWTRDCRRPLIWNIHGHLRCRAWPLSVLDGAREEEIAGRARQRGRARRSTRWWPTRTQHHQSLNLWKYSPNLYIEPNEDKEEKYYCWCFGRTQGVTVPSVNWLQVWRWRWWVESDWA